VTRQIFPQALECQHGDAALRSRTPSASSSAVPRRYAGSEEEGGSRHKKEGRPRARPAGQRWEERCRGRGRQAKCRYRRIVTFSARARRLRRHSKRQRDIAGWCGDEDLVIARRAEASSPASRPPPAMFHAICAAMTALQVQRMIIVFKLMPQTAFEADIRSSQENTRYGATVAAAGAERRQAAPNRAGRNIPV